MRQIINHFTDDDLYKFSMCCAVIDNYPRAQVKYAFVDRHNAANPDAEPLAYSSVEFIEKASGIKARHVMSKAAILDPDTMCPRLAERANDELSVMAEIGVAAAKQALERAGRAPEDVDAVRQTMSTPCANWPGASTATSSSAR